MAKTALFSRHTPGGVFHIEDQSISTGDRFYVHHSGSTTGGTNPDDPLTTIDAAINKATASQGDIIYAMPGHAENLAAVDTIDLDKAGISIVGLGQGNLIPTLSSTAAAGAITVAAANCSIKNVRMKANFATGVTNGLVVGGAGDGLTLDGVQFRDTSTANEFKVHIFAASGVTDLTIKQSSFVCLDGGSATNSILFAGTTENLVIDRCHFFVDTTDSVIDHLTSAGVNVLIKENIIYNADDQTAGYLLDFHASTTGLAVNNRGAYNKNNAEMTKGDAMWWLENYFSNTIAESGLLEPASSHAIP
jgi:hypothetical protein